MSLRVRVLLLVFTINTLVFAAGGLYLLRLQFRESERQDQQRANLMQYVVRSVTSTLGERGLNVPHILRFEGWGGVEDALLVDNSLGVAIAGGDVETHGIEINPVGVARRWHDFDRQAVLRACMQAEETQRAVENVEGGRVLPIEQPWGQDIWWGVWYRTQSRGGLSSLALGLLPWFLFSTLSLTIGSFFALRHLVLDPVARLAEGARSVRAGDLSVRLEVPDRRDELTDLVRSFNDMTTTVSSFNLRLAEEVQRATEKARQAEAAAMTQRRLAAMGELAAGIAHEINNPLGGLENAVITLGRGDLGEEKRGRYLRLLSSGLRRIGETVNRLRRFTPRNTQHELVDLNDVVRDSIELLRHRADRLGTEFIFEPRPVTDSCVKAARNEVGQALLNLLSNSLDALEEAADEARLQDSGDAGRVSIILFETAGVPGGLTARVRDNGPGVKPEDLARVQDLFFTTKEVGKGTGLGLALVHNMMAQHGGSVEITSEPGSFFQVDLVFPPQDPGSAGQAGRSGEES